MRLLDYKKKSLFKLGTIPNYDIKGGAKNIVDWYLKLETQLQDLLDLGQANSDDEGLHVVIYSLDIIRTVADMFEKQEGEMGLASVQDQQGRVCLQVLKDRITERRTSAQEWLHTKEFAQISPGPGKKTGISPSTTNFDGQIPKSLVVYNSPRNDSNCSIYQILEFNGDIANLYGNHHFNFATGCSRYMMMNPDYHYKDHKCGTVPVNGKKTSGSIFINKVCDITRKVTGEYTCTLKLKDGNRAILEGCIVDKIT